MSEETYNKPCWVDEIDCIYKEDKCAYCERPRHRYGKIVYCNLSECQWIKEVPMQKIILRSGPKPMFEEEVVFNSICMRDEISIQSQQFNPIIAKCPHFTRKFISGHMDWSRFPAR